MNLARFFRRYPGWLFALRLVLFAGLFPLFAGYAIRTGEVPSRGGPILRAETPQFFWALVTMFIFSALVVTAASTIIYLKKAKLIRKDWKLLGLDIRR